MEYNIFYILRQERAQRELIHDGTFMKGSKHMQRAIILSTAFRIVRGKSTENNFFQCSIPQLLHDDGH